MGSMFTDVVGFAAILFRTAERLAFPFMPLMIPGDFVAVASRVFLTLCENPEKAHTSVFFASRHRRRTIAFSK
jgi:hypothetical protein